MSKYQPLEKYLVEKGFDEISMTFEQIESVVGCALPPSARKYRAWWSNNSGNSVMTHARIAAGYRSARVTLEGEKVVFVKTTEQATPKSLPPDWAAVTDPEAGDVRG